MTPGTARVTTNRGEVIVPTWSFTVQGMSHPIDAVAVASDEIPRYVAPPPPPDVASPGAGIMGAVSLLAVTGTTLTVAIGHGACDGDLRGHIIEYDDLVVVGATSTPMNPRGGCIQPLLTTATTLTLSRPLGDRPVIDIATGQARFLGLPGL